MLHSIPKEVDKHGVMTTLQVIGGKWKPLILFILLNEGVKRFGELRRALPEVTQGMLTSHLRELEKDGLINRVIYNEIPPKVEYSLTAYGKTLEPVLTQMCNWGFMHRDQTMVEDASSTTEDNTISNSQKN